MSWDAWAAGIFEGEGSVSIVYRHGERASVRMQVNMTDEDVMRRFVEVVGGKLLGPYVKSPDHKPIYLWQRGGFDELRRVYAMFEPYLGARRRERFAEAFRAEPVEPPGHHYRDQTHCKRGHPLSGDNLQVRRGRTGRICRTCNRDRQRAARTVD